MVEHRVYHNFVVKFQDNRILAAVPDYMERLVWAAVELEFCSNDINKEDGLVERVMETSELSFNCLERTDGPPVAMTSLWLF